MTKLRRRRLSYLERAFDVELPAETPDLCATPADAAEYLVRTLAVVEEAPPLRGTAAMAVEEAMREVLRIDPSVVVATASLEELRGRMSRALLLRRLEEELRCSVPRLKWAVGEVILAAAFLYWSVGALIASWGGAGAFRSLPRLPILLGLLSALIAGLGAWLLLRVGLFRHPIAYVAGLVTWLVATQPSRLRGGTAWSKAQVTEVVEAVFVTTDPTRESRSTDVASAAVRTAIALLRAVVVFATVSVLLRVFSA